jgi:galactose-1-phosphate uridylyltransferase
MGCSNPHPHGQIWTTTTLPEESALELEPLIKYRHGQGTHLLVDYATLEHLIIQIIQAYIKLSNRIKSIILYTFDNDSAE